MAAFVDSNILIYAFAATVKPGDEHKQAVAESLVASLIQSDQFVISVQVLNEFYYNATRKGAPPLTHEEAATALDLLVGLTVLSIDTLLVQRAAERSDKNQINYYDALIVEAALRAGSPSSIPKTCTTACASTPSKSRIRSSPDSAAAAKTSPARRNQMRLHALFTSVPLHFRQTAC